MNKFQLCYYMDSVTKNTPILLKENGSLLDFMQLMVIKNISIKIFL